MSNPFTLTERAVKSFVGERSFSLGKDYIADGVLSHLRRIGRTVDACVQGTASRPYKVTVRFDDNGGLQSGNCTCPVGGGSCKHVAAVLITFCRTPDAFVEGEELDTKLQKLDKPRLIALLKQIFRKDPDLEILLDTIPRGKKPLSPQAFGAQADSVYDNAPDEWGYTGEIADGLRSIVETGDGFLTAGQHENAAAVYQGVMQSALAHEYALNDDEPGDIDCVIQDCATGLGKCLAVITDSQARKPILHALFDLVLMDMERGGAGMSDDAFAILEDQTSPANRRELAERIRAELKSATGYARQSLTDLLEQLESGER
jgi:hypothetical protein